MVECARCGYRNDAGSRFCAACGTALITPPNNAAAGPGWPGAPAAPNPGAAQQPAAPPPWPPPNPPGPYGAALPAEPPASPFGPPPAAEFSAGPGPNPYAATAGPQAPPPQPPAAGWQQPPWTAPGQPGPGQPGPGQPGAAAQPELPGPWGRQDPAAFASTAQPMGPSYGSAPGAPAQPSPYPPPYGMGHDPAQAAMPGPPMPTEPPGQPRASQPAIAPGAGLAPERTSAPGPSSPPPGLDPEHVPADSPRVLAAFLVSYENSELGHFWPVFQGRNEVGRAGAAEGLHVMIDHPTTSSRHAVLLASARPARLKVEDVGSTNGTYVNGERILRGARYEVRDGESLRFGGFNVTLKLL